MFKINNKYFTSSYDACKYVMQIAAEGQNVEIGKVDPKELFMQRLQTRK